MALTHSGWAVLVVLLVAATGPVAAADLAPAHESPTAGTDTPLPATGTPFDDDTINDTTDGTVDTNTTDDETVDETVETTTTGTATTVETTATDDSDTTTTTTSTSVTDDTDTTTTTVTDDTDVTSTTESASSTNGTLGNTSDEATESTTETIDGTVDDTTEPVETSTESLSEGATDTVESTTADLDSSNLLQTDATLTNTSLTDTSTLTESSLTNTTSDTLDGTAETTDDVAGVLSGDGSDSLELSSGSDSDLLSLDAAAVVESADDSATGGAGEGGDDDGSDDGDGGDGDGGDGSDGDDAETVVSVETENEQRGTVSRVLDSAWETLDGAIPEDAPVGPSGAAGIGALGLLAVASRQWFVHSSGSGMPTLLSSGLPGSTGDWVEKLKRLAVPLRYSRYDDSDPLEHDTRRTLHDAIEAAPGVNLTTLADRTDVPLSTARHHVRVLADENLVTTAKRRGKRRYYPAGADDVELADALSEPPKAAVLHALARHGEAHVGLLADELDRDPSTVTHHLQALADDGLVEREKRGRTVVNRLTDSARSTLGGDDHATSEYADLPADD